jgi:hypothetical protein
VRVTLHRVLSPWPELRSTEIDAVTTESLGEFSFGTSRGPALMLFVEHAEYAREWVLADEEDPRLTVRMTPGFEVSGIVLGPDGDPVPDCTVVLEPGSWDTRRAESVTTDRRGAFRLPRVHAGIARVSARHRLYQPAILPAVTVGASEGLRLHFRESSLVLSGKVVTTDNPPRPVSGAEVRGLPNTWNGSLFLPQKTTTDAGGEFSLEGLGPGNLRVEVRHRDLSTTARVVTMGPSTQPLQLEMATRSRVHGQLTGNALLANPRGRSLNGWELVLTNTVGEQARTSVGTDGSFEFPGTFSAGPASLDIVRGSLAFASTSSRDLVILVEESITPRLDLPVVLPSIVEGLVRNEGGEPIAGARILIGSRHQKLPAPHWPGKLVAVTGAAGRFRIRGLPVGQVSARIQHDDHATWAMSLAVPAPGETGQVPDIVLARSGGIFGRVTLEDGRALAGALVSATLGTSTVVEVSGPDGRYRLRDLSPGRYRLRALYSTLPVALADEAVQVESGAVEGPIPLLFPAGRTIVGIVQDAEGHPLEDAVVTVSGTGGALILTDSSGRFHVQVPRRQLELQAYSSDFSVHTAKIVGLEEDQVTLRLETAPSGTLVARVRGLPGNRPVPGGIIRATPIPPSPGAPPSRTTPIRSQWVEMRDGVLHLPGFPAGRSLLVLQCQGYGPFVREITVAPREELDLGQILLEPGNRVLGLVTGADGKPVPGAEVFLGTEIDREQFEAPSETTTDAEGLFEVQGVTPDSRTLVIVAPGYATRTVELRIPQDIIRREPLAVSLDRGSSIQVKVFDVEGRPWEMSVVFLKLDGFMLPGLLTDEDGLATFEYRSPGTYEVTLFGSTGVSEEVIVGEDSQRVYQVVLRGRE